MENKNEIILEKGMETDANEAWKKLTERQFPGNTARAFSEIVQNMLDSYGADIPWDQRKGDIVTGKNSISLTDYGSGLTVEKLDLLRTMGGTDKNEDPDKIGMFGIGFFSIFNKLLKTSMVVVTSSTNGETVQLTFKVIRPGEIPELEICILDTKINFSTKVEVFFDSSYIPQECLQFIKNSLDNYPCRFRINGKPYMSIWEREAQNPSSHRFQGKYCDGIIFQRHYWKQLKILCKYEPIIDVSLNSLIRGTSKVTWDLEDFRHARFPLIPEMNVLCNCNHLSLTISRDSFFLDYNWQNMLSDLKEEAAKVLLSTGMKNEQLMLANLYIFQQEVATFLSEGEVNTGQGKCDKLVEKLANAKIFRISGDRRLYSVYELKNKLTEGLPLFYSPNKNNLFWAGRKFKHDFILLPERSTLENGANLFYHTLLKTLFNDIVNLDHIQGNHEMINSLIERGIVDEKALTPKVKFVGKRRNSPEEAKLLHEINMLLQDEQIIKAIEHNLFLTIDKIETVFFTIEEQGAYISTGIFDEDRNPLDENSMSNFVSTDEEDDQFSLGSKLLLGLQKNHPLIGQLVNSTNPQRAYFALTYIANELVLSQKLLKPHSHFFHIAREKLATDLRMAMMESLLSEFIES